MAFDYKSLITDRTAGDVEAGNAKGSYGAEDLNRVGMAVADLCDTLTAAGYDVQVNPRTDWTDADWMDPAAASAFLADLQEVRRQLTVYQSTPDVPEALRLLTYQTANDIEQILMDVEKIYQTMLTTYVASGEAVCGGDYL